MKCLITGCQLRLYNYPQVVAGDLHISTDGTTLVFGGNVDGSGNAQWLEPEFHSFTSGREVHIPVGYEHFHRRGVFVFAWAPWLLNQEAIDYIRG